VDDITPFLPGDTVAILRIADDRRQFPFRPVASGLFLIGQGAGCDLRLGDDQMPALHSVLQISSEVAEVNRVAEHPELVVNGDPVQRAQLSSGDLIEIGQVRMVFQLCSAVCPEIQSEPALKTTAIEFVGGIESELALIEALHQSDSERIQELLKAAHEAVDGLDCARTIRFLDYATPAPAEPVTATNDPYGPMILSRFQAQESRLSDVCQVVEQVVKQQQLIATALQCLVDRLDELKAAPTASGSLRASA
jgi:hypothetical protein